MPKGVYLIIEHQVLYFFASLKSSEVLPPCLQLMDGTIGSNLLIHQGSGAVFRILQNIAYPLNSSVVLQKLFCYHLCVYAWYSIFVFIKFLCSDAYDVIDLRCEQENAHMFSDYQHSLLFLPKHFASLL